MFAEQEPHKLGSFNLVETPKEFELATLWLQMQHLNQKSHKAFVNYFTLN